MPVILTKNLPRSKRFAPRVDGQSLILENGASGEAQQARLNSSALNTNNVVVWDSANDRLGDGELSKTKLAYLDVATQGTAQAGKAVVLDSSKDISGLRNITLTAKLKANSVEAGSVTVSSGITTSNISITGDTTLQGTIGNVVLRYGSYLAIRKSGSTAVFSVVKRDTSSGRLFYGGITEGVVLYSSSSDIVHKTPAGEFRMWDANNHGANSGLDADLLDGQHGAYYRNADNINTGVLSTSRIPGLDASKITSGTFGTTRVPLLNDKADKINVLLKNNTTAYTPTADYHPSTKKYVDDSWIIRERATCSKIYSGLSSITTMTAIQRGNVIYLNFKISLTSLPSEDTVLFTLPSGFPNFTDFFYFNGAGTGSNIMNFKCKAGSNQIIAGQYSAGSTTAYGFAAIPLT